MVRKGDTIEDVIKYIEFRIRHLKLEQESLSQSQKEGMQKGLHTLSSKISELKSIKMVLHGDIKSSSKDEWNKWQRLSKKKEEIQKEARKILTNVKYGMCNSIESTLPNINKLTEDMKKTRKLSEKINDLKLEGNQDNIIYSDSDSIILKGKIRRKPNSWIKKTNSEMMVHLCCLKCETPVSSCSSCSKEFGNEDEIGCSTIPDGKHYCKDCTERLDKIGDRNENV